MIGTINSGNKEEFLSGFIGRGQEGSEKKEGKPCRIGTRGASLFTAHIRCVGTPGICGDGGRENGEGELICMFQQLWAREGNLFHEY